MKDLFSLRRALELAAPTAVAPRNVHLDDHILHFLLDHPKFPDPVEALTYYLNDGKASAEKLASLLGELDIGQHEPIALLEFASGYGCVTRHLRAALPRASVTACDIHPQAVEFICRELLCSAVLSHREPELLSLPQQYDVIFALSFYSHVPRETWGRWIRAHVEALTPNGVLIFTTHGRYSCPFFGNPTIPENGFWFSAQSEQKDLSLADYGMTIVMQEFVEREVWRQTGRPVRVYREKFWWDHQDLYVIAKNDG